MRKIMLFVALLSPSPAVAQEAGDDLAMKTDTMIMDGDTMIVEPNGHVSIVAPSAERRKAMETDFAVRGVEVSEPIVFMLRDGKLRRLDGALVNQPVLTVK